MTTTATVTPEDMYASFVGHVAAYARLSATAAAANDPVTAVYAAWASDIAAVQAVVLERVMVSSPRPDEQFLTVANSATHALAAYAASPAATGDAATAVAAARESLRAAFADEVMVLFYSRFASLTHLTGMPIPTQASIDELLMEVTGGVSLQVFLDAKQAEARTLMDAATDALQSGDTIAAVTYAYQSDLVSAEWHITREAVNVGDRNLITRHLRWALLCEAAEQLPALPPVFDDAAAEVRSTILRAMGPIDSARLAGELLPLPSAS